MFDKSAGTAVGESDQGRNTGWLIGGGEDSRRIAKERRRKDQRKRKAKDEIDGREGEGEGGGSTREERVSARESRRKGAKPL